jgi:hypothetical protein
VKRVPVRIPLPVSHTALFRRVHLSSDEVQNSWAHMRSGRCAIQPALQVLNEPVQPLRQHSSENDQRVGIHTGSPFTNASSGASFPKFRRTIACSRCVVMHNHRIVGVARTVQIRPRPRKRQFGVEHLFATNPAQPFRFSGEAAPHVLSKAGTVYLHCTPFCLTVWLGRYVVQT